MTPADSTVCLGASVQHLEGGCFMQGGVLPKRSDFVYCGGLLLPGPGPYGERRRHFRAALSSHDCHEIDVHY
jgi:hypothetical protein